MYPRFLVLLLLIRALCWPLPGQAAPPPPAPPVVAWRDPAHVVVTWVQGTDGQRCLSKESPSAPVYVYGCPWGWQGANHATLPRGPGPHPPAAIPAPGDTIVVGDERALVPPQHFLWLPFVGR